MSQIPTLFQLLYVSTFARGVRVNAVPQIITQSRIRNVSRGLTGLLVFDGEQFCQYLEGPETILQELLTHISKDKRHTDLKVLHRGPANKRRFASFAMGLATLGDDEEFLARLNQLEGMAAMACFFAGIEDLDRASDTTSSSM